MSVKRYRMSQKNSRHKGCRLAVIESVQHGFSSTIFRTPCRRLTICHLCSNDRKDIWHGKDAMKSAPCLLQKIRITSHMCQMMWSSQWLLWCHSCLELWVITCLYWKVKVSEQGGCLADFLKDEELSKKRKVTKGEHKSWWTVGWNQICWDLFSSRSMDGHNFSGRKYSNVLANATKLWELMPCDCTGNDLLGAVWSVATPLGNSSIFLQFIGSSITFKQ